MSCVSHPIISKKHPSVAPPSGEKRRTITLEKKLKIITWHEGGELVMAITCDSSDFLKQQSTILMVSVDEIHCHHKEKRWAS